jgi:hypothetical protein
MPQSRTGERARLVDWRPVADNPSLAGRATIDFDGWVVAGIPIFKKGGGSLSSGVPSCPVLAPDGTHAVDQAGKRRYVPVITFGDCAARERWDRAVLAALADAGVAL